MTNKDKPYLSLGHHLKTVREQAKRTLAEVSGALEIDEMDLMNMEAGIERPDEELMLLLISYFDMVDQEALHIWELAEYDTDLEEHMEFDAVEIPPSNQANIKPMVMLLNMEPRTMYSDNVQIAWNKAGVILDFSQSTPKGQQSISKVGMSLEQAAEVAKCLERALLHAKYVSNTKLLPPKKKPEN